MATSPLMHNDPTQKPGDSNTKTNTSSTSPADSTPQTGGVQSKIPGILALTVTAGFFALIAILAFHDMPQRSSELIDILLGALTTGWVMILTFYFGSTAGSQEKTRIMSNMTRKP